MGMDIGQVLNGLKVHAKNQPNKLAIIYNDEEITFKDLNNRVNALANSLLSRGVRKGDHVILYMRNRLEMAEVYYALGKIGAVAVPVNYMIEGDSLTQLIERADAKVVIMESEQLTKYQKVAGRLEKIDAQSTYVIRNEKDEHPFSDFNELRKGATDEVSVEFDSDHIFAMLYTSGTTSLPKGILIPNGTHILRCMRFSSEWNVKRNSVMMVTVPMYHAVGHLISFFPVLLGATIVITREFEPESILEAIQNHQVTHAFFIPIMYNGLLSHPSFDQYDFSSLELLVCAAAPLSATLKRLIIEKFNTGLLEFFGSSETSAYLTLFPEDVVRKTDSIGQQLAHYEIRLVNDDGVDVKQGEEGEFAVRSPLLFKEYYNQPKTTEASFLSGGWFLTGDMGKEDDEAFYYILDRKKDMLISGGVNVYPRDIEIILEQHADVQEVAVIGMPNERWGEVPKAFVAKKPDALVTEEELLAFANAKLLNFQRIKELEFVDMLPRNPSGKILKFKLRELEVKR